MNWNDLLLSVLGVVLTGLATWGLTLFTTWMNSKLKDRKSLKFATAILNIVTDCVKATYQTYVQSIKGTDLWTKEAQEKALQMALETAKSKLNADAQAYIVENYGDVDTYLINLIEAILYDLKK